MAGASVPAIAWSAQGAASRTATSQVLPDTGTTAPPIVHHPPVDRLTGSPAHQQHHCRNRDPHDCQDERERPSRGAVVHARWSGPDLPVGKVARQPSEKTRATHEDQGDPDGTPGSGLVYVLSGGRWVR